MVLLLLPALPYGLASAPDMVRASSLALLLVWVLLPVLVPDMVLPSAHVSVYELRMVWEPETKMINLWHLHINPG